MYGSIDAASKALNRKLRKYKERRTAGWHGGKAMNDDLSEALDSLEEIEDNEDLVDEFFDIDQPSITKVDSFDLERPISIEEAIFALDYVDHDFYVFRNEATEKVSVVYRRHVGGVGLIEP